MMSIWSGEPDQVQNDMYFQRVISGLKNSKVALDIYLVRVMEFMQQQVKVHFYQIFPL